MFLHGHPDVDFGTACLHAYNRWLAEFCAKDPNRLIGLAYLPAIGGEAAAAELERVVKLGAKGAAIVCWPSGNDQLSKADDPLWAKAAGTRRFLSASRI